MAERRVRSTHELEPNDAVIAGLDGLTRRVKRTPAPDRRRWLALALAMGTLVGCDDGAETQATTDDPIETTTDTPPDIDDGVAEVAAETTPAEDAPAPLTHRLLPRPDAFVFPDGCFDAHAATADEALRSCRRLARTGSALQRRYCECRRDRLIEVTPDDPIAFYRGCCWAPGATPELARAECERRHAAGWCEEGATDEVTIATGPYVRRAAARIYESLDVHRYLVPTDIMRGEGTWVSREGEPPCFAEGTMVELEDGPRPIEAVRVGDRVVTSTEGRRATAPVLDLKTRVAHRLIALELGDRVLRVTPEHPISVDGAWIAARRLREGDVLVGLEEPVRITGIAIEERERTVHTLRVGTPHQFFAGGVLVHNY